MFTPLRELPGYKALQAMRQLEWRFQTLQEDYEEAISHENPSLEAHEWTFQFSRRDELYEAEKLLHHYLSGYYTYWRQVMTVGHETGKPECRGRIESRRDEHDEKPSARITRGLRMYVQKENVLPLLVFQSEHDDTTPKYALNKDDVYREGLYNPSFEHYFGTVEETCIFPYEVIEANWVEVVELHEDVKDLIREYMGDELEEYAERVRTLDKVSEDVPLTPIMEEILPTADPLADELIDK